MNNIKHHIKKTLDVYLAFLLFVIVFTFIVRFVKTDIQQHIGHVIKINNNLTNYPGNFLFYLTVNLCSGFLNYKPLIYFVTIILLSVATGSKYMISKNLINHLVFRNLSNRKLSIITIGLFFCYAIPEPFTLFFHKHMYFGKFVPIVWHNSTTILLFPFALLLFIEQLKVLNPLYIVNYKNILVINMLVVINIFIKPSFIFVYAPVTFIFLLSRINKGEIKKSLLILTPIFTSIVFILGQYFMIYILEEGSFNIEKSGVALSYPFEVLIQWIPIWYLPISFALSFALPIYTIVKFKSIWKYRPFCYAFFLLIAGLIISAFLKETGPRLNDGNFFWQNIICTYLLFLTSISFLIPKFLNNTIKPKRKFVIISLFILHILSGVLYLIKIGLTNSYG